MTPLFAANAVVEVFNGSCGGLTRLDCKFQNCKGSTNLVVTLPVGTGEQFYIRIGQFLGSYKINFTFNIYVGK